MIVDRANLAKALAMGTWLFAKHLFRQRNAHPQNTTIFFCYRKASLRCASANLMIRFCAPGRMTFFTISGKMDAERLDKHHPRLAEFIASIEAMQVEWQAP